VPENTSTNQQPAQPNVVKPRMLAIPQDVKREPITVRVPQPLRDAWLEYVGKHGGDETTVLMPAIANLIGVQLPTGYAMTIGKARMSDEQKAYAAMTQLIVGKVASIKRDYALSHNGNLPTAAIFVNSLLWNISRNTKSNAKLNKPLARTVIAEMFPDGWEAGQAMFAADVAKATGVTVAA
jgi:hypothetical protein